MLDLMQPDSGEIEIFGSKVNEDNFRIKRQIGSIIESPFFYEKLSGRKNLELHAKYMGLENIYDINTVLNMVSLTESALKKVSQYSLGMKQRLAIARAILTHPQLLILDEPINALDPQGILEMRQLLLDLSKKEGMTILISSHILSEVEHIADQIGIIKDGHIIKEITPQAYQQEYIELIVENNSKAESILQSKNIEFTIENTNHFFIKSQSISVEELTALMLQNKVGLSSISKAKRNLEDYFLKLFQQKNPKRRYSKRYRQKPLCD